MSMTINSSCVHFEGDDRNRCTGEARLRAKAELKESHKGGTQLANEKLDSLSKVEYASNNSKGQPTNRKQFYNIAQEEQQALKVSGLVKIDISFTKFYHQSLLHFRRNTSSDHNG